MKEMYKGMVNSPQTKIDQAINAADTDIKVKDGSVFPPGPNLATIGIDQYAETILYSSVNNNILVGCTRGYQSAAKNWESNSPIARNFTEADLTAVQENIRTLDGKTLAEMSGDESHRTVSDDEKSSWNNKVDKVDGKGLSANDFTDAAKKKVDAIPPDPKYTDTIQDLTSYAKKTDLPTKISQLSEDTEHRTVSDDEKDAWNNKVDKAPGKQLSTNDYTTVEKNKVRDIPDNPKYTDTVTTINGNTGEISKADIVALGIPGSAKSYSVATTTSDGLLSATDKKKLDSVKEQVILTQTQYNALSTDQKNDASKIYFIRA